MDERSVVDALSTPEAQDAIARGAHGQVIRIIRDIHGMKQSELGALIGYTQTAVSLMESGARSIGEDTRRAIAGQLDIPLPALGLPGPFTPDDATHTLANVNRQNFLRGALGVAAALAFPGVLTTEDPTTIGPDQVQECRDVLGRLMAVDARVGGGGVYEVSAELAHRVHRLARKTRYTPAVGRDLNAVLASSYETAAWLAYDAGRYGKARTHWLEGMHTADMHRLPGVHPRAMAGMAMHATASGWGGEAVQLTQTAAKTPGLTPRVLSLLAAREATGHAAAGDRAASERAFARSAALLDRGASSDDPAWIAFWGPDDFACHRSIAAACLGNLATAEMTARAALRGARAASGGYTRNEMLYGVKTALLLARRRSVDEAISLARPAVAAYIESQRIRAELHTTVELIGKNRDYRPAREFTAWANRLMGAA